MHRSMEYVQDFRQLNISIRNVVQIRKIHTFEYQFSFTLEPNEEFLKIMKKKNDVRISHHAFESTDFPLFRVI